MVTFDIAYSSVNFADYARAITATVILPEVVDGRTGVCLCTHGWAGNRFMYMDTMRYAAERFNVISVGVEFRQSGHAFDPVRGVGSDCPYDASFYQVFDVLSGLRAVLEMYPTIHRGRIFHYGGSQGGHIAMLSSIFAPNTFAFVYATSPVVFMDAKTQGWAGREFSEDELCIRSLLDQAERLTVPLCLEHGLADDVIPSETHTKALQERLTALGRDVPVEYVEGGDHMLQPTVTRLEMFKRRAEVPMSMFVREGRDDFAAGTIVEIPCRRKTLRIDWSQAKESAKLFEWR